jgi:hypothetical protein
LKIGDGRWEMGGEKRGAGSKKIEDGRWEWGGLIKIDQ